MGDDTILQNPFAILSLIAAPAILTNATAVLALSTTNRFLRAAERMRALSTRLEGEIKSEALATLLLTQVNRVEKQALLLLRALRCVYLALGCFAIASLVSIIGASLASTQFHFWFRAMVGLGLAVGFTGAGSLVWGSVHLVHATRLSLMNITEEAALIREQEAKRRQKQPGGVNLPPG